MIIGLNTFSYFSFSEKILKNRKKFVVDKKFVEKQRFIYKKNISDYGNFYN